MKSANLFIDIAPDFLLRRQYWQAIASGIIRVFNRATQATTSSNAKTK